MAASGSSVQTFIRQWLTTATKDGVSVDFAWSQDRMQLRCKCGAIYRCNIPEDTVVMPWELQKYVTQHSDPNKWKHHEEEKTPVDPIPLTADFKPLIHINPAFIKTHVNPEQKADSIKTEMVIHEATKAASDIEEQIDWMKKVGVPSGPIEHQQKALIDLLSIMTKVSQVPFVPAPPPAKPVVKPAKIVSGRRFR